MVSGLQSPLATLTLATLTVFESTFTWPVSITELPPVLKSALLPPVVALIFKLLLTFAVFVWLVVDVEPEVAFALLVEFAPFAEFAADTFWPQQVEQEDAWL